MALIVFLRESSHVSHDRSVSYARDGCPSSMAPAAEREELEELCSGNDRQVASAPDTDGIWGVRANMNQDEPMNKYM